MRRCWRREEVQESQGLKDQDISNSHSNTSLTLKKVHLVFKSVAMISGNVKKKKSIFKDIIQVGGWVLKAFSKFF